jgi:hypothetical protein
MTTSETRTNDEAREQLLFVIRAWSFLRISPFELRHFPSSLGRDFGARPRFHA